jgi:regulatory associated protein of mTOR
VASLFRNFLLAERIMRDANCTPISSPKLPPTCILEKNKNSMRERKKRVKRRKGGVIDLIKTDMHPMWEVWDLAMDVCLSQLPAMLANPARSFSVCTNVILMHGIDAFHLTA